MILLEYVLLDVFILGYVLMNVCTKMCIDECLYIPGCVNDYTKARLRQSRNHLWTPLVFLNTQVSKQALWDNVSLCAALEAITR